MERPLAPGRRSTLDRQDLHAEVPVRQVKLSEVVVYSLHLVFIALLVAQRFRSVFSDDKGPIPFLDPPLNGWLPALLVLMVAGIAVDALLYVEVATPRPHDRLVSGGCLRGGGRGTI